MRNFGDKVDEICDLIYDPESEFYSLAHWDESGTVTLNAPVAHELANLIEGVEAINANTIRVTR